MVSLIFGALGINDRVKYQNRWPPEGDGIYHGNELSGFLEFVNNVIANN